MSYKNATQLNSGTTIIVSIGSFFRESLVTLWCLGRVFCTIAQHALELMQHSTFFPNKLEGLQSISQQRASFLYQFVPFLSVINSYRAASCALAHDQMIKNTEDLHMLLQILKSLCFFSYFFFSKNQLLVKLFINTAHVFLPQGHKLSISPIGSLGQSMENTSFCCLS